jgi:large subunit ribosomal protein L17
MRHGRSGRKLGRDAAHRKALYANLTGALIEHGRIKTTAAKAKEVRPVAEQMITLGRRGGVPARRQALKFLRSQDVVHKLFSDVGPRFVDRPGGYSRIIRIGPRQGDAAEMVYLELVDYVAEGAAAAPPRPAREREPEPEGEVEEEPADEAVEPEPEAEAEPEAESEEDASR